MTGTFDNGQICVDASSSDKIWIMLDGVSIHCDDNAAICVEQADKVFLTLADGTDNTVTTGDSYTDTAVENGVDGAIYARDDLTINGSGNLSVTTGYQHGVVCNDDLVIAGGNLTIHAKEDGLHANDSARFTDMKLEIAAGDDGVTVSNDAQTAYIYVQSGTMNITECYEGMEAIQITIAGGDLTVCPSDDGLNANGSGGDSLIRMTAGSVTVLNGNGRDADGLDSNGSISIEGGTVFVSLNGDGSNSALDCGTENGGTCSISGGTVIACGGSSMAEGFDGDSSTQCSLLHTLTATAAADSLLSLLDADGNALVSQQIPNSYSCVVLSTPEMKQGETYTLSYGDASEEITLTDMATSNSAGGMMGGGRMGGFGGGFNESWSDADSSQSFGFGRGNRGERTSEESGSSFNGENGFGGRMDGNRQKPSGDFSMPDGEMPSMPDGEMPSMPDGEMPSMPDGEMPSIPDGERMSRPEGGLPDGMQSGMHEEESATEAVEETGTVDFSTWIWVAVCAVALLAGIFIAVLFKGRSMFG